MATLQTAAADMRRQIVHDLSKAARVASKARAAAQTTQAAGTVRQLTVEREQMMQMSREVADKLEELRLAVDILRVDVTRRKVKPAAVRRLSTRVH